MSDLNSVAFTARMARDPELRVANSSAVATLRVAINREKGSDNQDRGAAFWDVEVWGRLAENCCLYLAKGRRIAVDGGLEHREWEKNGTTRHAYFVKARRVQFLDSPVKAGDGSREDEIPI
jgi:single-strand DNA-binding protein